MAAVGGELKAKTSFFTVLCLALAFWQGLSAVNADATAASGTRKLMSTEIHVHFGTGRCTGCDVATQYSPEPSGSPPSASSVNTSPPLPDETKPPSPVLVPPPPSPSPPPPPSPPAARFPDVTCPPLEQVPLSGPGGHNYYTCAGFAGVFCSPAANTQIGENPFDGYHRCDTPYVRPDNTYGVTTRTPSSDANPCTSSNDCDATSFCDGLYAVADNQLHFCNSFETHAEFLAGQASG